MIDLASAVKEGRLEDFIRQQEAAGVGPIDEAAFDLAASNVIKHETQSDQTSHCSSRDDLSGKRIR